MEQLPTAQQLQSLIEALDEQEKMMVWLDCVTAARPGELLALRPKSIDFQRNCIWIVEAVNNSRIHSSKSHRSHRPIPLTEEDMERLRQFMDRRPSALPHDWVFPSDRVKGPRQYANTMARKIQSKARDLGLPHVTWRLFRHWHATLLADTQRADQHPVWPSKNRLKSSRCDTSIAILLATVGGNRSWETEVGLAVNC